MGYELINEAAAMVKLNTFIENASKRDTEFPNSKTSLDSKKMFKAYKAISNWPDYKQTELIKLNKVAEWCGIKSVLYKDESTRFGLGSFKALGGAYAVATLAKEYQKEGKDSATLTVATATDGNHGRSVSWGAKLAGCKSKIFIHANVSQERERAMTVLGADVVRINGNYEASLAACKEAAELNNWPIVSDTSWKGYRETPMQIMAGYSVMSKEIIEQMGSSRPSHTILPIGVGGLAAGIVAPMWEDMNANLGKMISVESHFSQCFLNSISNGKPTLVDIKEETLMAGLSCGEVSEIAWEILKPTLSHCMSIADDGIAKIMQLFANGDFGETSIEAGECSASGLAALLIAKNNPSIWRQLELNKDSTVLLIGTEGATDPILYKQLIGS
jgi:diaminopropionate ammonia-lyase